MKLCRLILMFLAMALVITSSACIIPPNDLRPSVLPEQELTFVSDMKRGKDYALSGRFELAEYHFRQALRLDPLHASVYNDLGFILKGQTRNREAVKMFQYALKINPDDIAARQNLARTFYAQGNYDEALVAFKQILVLNSERIAFPTREFIPLSPQELGALHRNISMIYYTQGLLDDALCHSQLALNYTQSSYDISRHARLLMSLNINTSALGLLQYAVNTRRSEVSSGILLDYGIALYVEGQYRLSDEALTRVLALPNAQHRERQSARIMRMLVSSSLDQTNITAELFRTLNEENDKLCDYKQVLTEAYWPISASENAENIVEKYCNDEFKSEV